MSEHLPVANIRGKDQLVFSIETSGPLALLMSAATSDLGALFDQLEGWAVPWATHGRWEAAYRAFGDVHDPGGPQWQQTGWRLHPARVDHGPREVAA